MKKLLISAMVALVAIYGQAQTIVHTYHHEPRHSYYDHHVSHFDHRYDIYHHHHYHDRSAADAAVVAAGVIGAAAIIGTMAEQSAQESAARQTRAALYEERKENARQDFQMDIQRANDSYHDGDYREALRLYTRCAEINDKYKHVFGDQERIVNRIGDCNSILGNYERRSSVVNNFQARHSDYSDYEEDILNPAYVAKYNCEDTRITRISRSATETRVELEYCNTNFGQGTVNVKGNTYIKGKHSGRLQLCRVENIAMAPANTIIPYGGQTLKFALIFPALDPQDDTFTLCEPSTDWSFSDLSWM